METDDRGSHATSLAATARSASSPAASAATRVPALAGQRLDVAEILLGRRGLRWSEIGGGMFGIVVNRTGLFA